MLKYIRGKYVEMTREEIAVLKHSETSAEAHDTPNDERVQALEKTVAALKKEVAALKKTVKG